MNVNLICRLVINDVTLNVYRYKISEMYIEFREKPIVDTYSFIIYEKEKPNYHYIKELKGSDLFKFIHASFYMGNAMFESEKAASIFDIFIDTFK